MNPHERAVQDLLQQRRNAAPVVALPGPVGDLKFCFAVSREPGSGVVADLPPPKPPSQPDPSFDSVETRYLL